MKRTLGDVIKSLRLERNMSQEQFAMLFNVAPSTVGMWENNKRSPNEGVKEAIANFFNVDMNYLYGLTPIRRSFKEEHLFAYYTSENSNKIARWNDIFKTVDFTDKEVDELINYTNFILSKRGAK